MSDSDPRPFDFREIAALDDAAVAFRNWVSKSSSFFSDFWSETSDYAAQLTLGDISTNSYSKAIESLSREVNYSIVDFVDYTPSMWHASNKDLRTIALAMLGLDDGPDVGDDALSPVEISLSQLFIEQLAIALVDGWMGDTAFELKPSALKLDPRKARFVRDKDLVTCTSVKIGLKSGAVGINWLLSKQKTSDLLESAVDNRGDDASPSEPQSASPQLVGRLPIDVVSVLGQATLPMSQLSDLQVGQLIELDQRIDQPVTAFVNETLFYEGWPGRRGKNQAIEITRCLHS
ncbi:FliM/FliN family flagellar motor switch protein [Planctomycetes bacterium K23_9]|uniref:Flagellar motor switch protein FliM n=1 Tax=Stieleria marina TaxID=1930275 RepID=A0A517NT04_9BACT|nr:Flagellar motor switch protein FliM [Planctomycetes bacterium K23_9]